MNRERRKFVAQAACQKKNPRQSRGLSSRVGFLSERCAMRVVTRGANWVDAEFGGVAGPERGWAVGAAERTACLGSCARTGGRCARCASWRHPSPSWFATARSAGRPGPWVGRSRCRRSCGSSCNSASDRSVSCSRRRKRSGSNNLSADAAGAVTLTPPQAIAAAKIGRARRRSMAFLRWVPPAMGNRERHVGGKF